MGQGGGKSGKDSGSQGSDYQKYMDYQKYIPGGGARTNENAQVPHVSNWSNQEELRDKFMGFYAKGQIPHVKNWSNPEKVNADFAAKFKPKTESATAVNLLAVSNASPESAGVSVGKKSTVHLAGIPEQISLVSEVSVRHVSHAWLFLGAAVPATGVSIMLVARRFRQQPAENDLNVYHLQA